MSPPLADEELIRRLAVGDEDALIELYRRHGRAVYSVAYYIVQDRSAAEEITQDAFIAVWQKVRQFDRRRGRLESWLLQITRNLAIDHLRFQRRRQTESLSPDSEQADTHARNGPPADAQHDELKNLLQRLPAEQRQVIELAYLQGYTHDEIAKGLQLPLGTVKSRILLGLRKLRALLSRTS